MQPPALPILDNHFHLDPRGDRGAAVTTFLKAGGTHLTLVHKPYGRPPPSTTEQHLAAFRTTLGLADEAREAGAVVWVALGPHPAELTMRMAAGDTLDEAAAAYERGLDVAAAMVREGHAVALGEVGRPHYEVEPEVMSTANRLFDLALTHAADLDCAAILHTEPGTAETFHEWAQRADAAGLARHKVVKHFAPPIVGADAHGLTPSLIGSRANVEPVAGSGHAFMLETDYMDDPDRPGAVLGPKTVPKRTRSLFDQGLIDEAAWMRMHHDVPRRVYGVDIAA